MNGPVRFTHCSALRAWLWPMRITVKPIDAIGAEAADTLRACVAFLRRPWPSAQIAVNVYCHWKRRRGACVRGEARGRDVEGVTSRGRFHRFNGWERVVWMMVGGGRGESMLERGGFVGIEVRDSRGEWRKGGAMAR